jgi:hypothetical protein
VVLVLIPISLLFHSLDPHCLCRDQPRFRNSAEYGYDIQRLLLNIEHMQVEEFTVCMVSSRWIATGSIETSPGLTLLDKL